MAAYASSVTLDAPHSKPVGVGVRMIRGTVDVTNYNTTLAEITGITEHFRDTPTVIVGGTTDNGYLVSWVAASKALKAWKFDYDAVADGAAIEAVTDTDIGAVSFVAFGR